MTKSDYEKLLNLPTVKAFLDMTAWAEGGTYNKLYGGGTFTGNQHPNRLINAGGYKSTAAGRYQFLYRTWIGIKNKLGLADFSPKNQDIACLELVRQRGELNNVINGNLLATLKGLGCAWASFPFSGCGQKEKSLSSITNYYNARLKYYGANPSALASNSVVADTATANNIVKKVISDIKSDESLRYATYGIGFILLLAVLRR